MEQRLANTWRMTFNERTFIESALLSEQRRIDARKPSEYRELIITFGGEDGSCEVQLGDTHVMAFVTAQLVKPYQDRRNEGTLTIFSEFSPMADPSFEAGRPGESAVELGRMIDRGLRESRAVDMESLCILAGKLVWSIRLDLHILDNGGNLVDAANIAALAALLTFRRPECSLVGDESEEVFLHPPEAREPLPLIVHHLPIAVTFVFLTEENIPVIDPNHYEEAVMKGRMTITLNTNGDVCAIQKAGGVGVTHDVIMDCLLAASDKASDVTRMIKDAVRLYDEGRALHGIKRQPSSATELTIQDPGARFSGGEYEFAFHKAGSGHHIHEPMSSRSRERSTVVEVEAPTELCGFDGRGRKAESSVGRPSSWDPYFKGVDSDVLKISLASRGAGEQTKRLVEKSVEKQRQHEAVQRETVKQSHLSSSPIDVSPVESDMRRILTLKDAVKPKNRRRKKSSPATNLI
ncbi:Exosome complex component RRP45B-like protein [Drosera capensis]